MINDFLIRKENFELLSNTTLTVLWLYQNNESPSPNLLPKLLRVYLKFLNFYKWLPDSGVLNLLSEL